MTVHETANLMLDDESRVYLLSTEDEEGDRDRTYLGDVEMGGYKVPIHLTQEFEELEAAWSEYCRETDGYRAGVMHDYYSTRGI